MSWLFGFSLVWLLTCLCILVVLSYHKYRNINANRFYFRLRRALFWSGFKKLLQLLYLPLTFNSLLCFTVVVEERNYSGDWVEIVSKVCSTIWVFVLCFALPALHMLSVLRPVGAIRKWRLPFNPLRGLSLIMSILFLHTLPLVQLAVIFGCQFLFELVEKNALRNKVYKDSSVWRVLC